MNLMKKLPPLLPVLIALVLSCGQVAFFDMVKNGLPVIYATSDTDDVTATLLIVATEKEVLGEFPTNIPPSPTPVYLHAVETGEVYIADGSSAIFSSDSRYQPPWKSYTVIPTIRGLASLGDQILHLNDVNTDCLYHLNRDTGAWESMGKSVTNPPYKIAASRDRDKIYVLSAYGGGTIDIYDMDDGSPVYPPFSAGPGVKYFTWVDGNFYTGKTNIAAGAIFINNITPAIASTADNIQSLSVESDTEIFGAGALAGNPLSLYRMEGIGFTIIYTFTSTSGTILIEAFKPGLLAVGINGSLSEDGLYIYDYAGNTLKKISARPIYLLHVKR